MLADPQRPHSRSLRQWLVGAKLAGEGPKLSGPVDRDDPAYRFRSNEQAAEAAVAAVVQWLLTEAGADGAFGSCPAFRSTAKHIVQCEKGVS